MCAQKAKKQKAPIEEAPASGKQFKLDKLLSGQLESDEQNYTPPPARAVTLQDGQTSWELAEELQDNPCQPRSVIDSYELEDLVQGFDQMGQLQAATATIYKGKKTLLTGHRRKYTVLAGANAGLHMPNPTDYIGKLRVEWRLNVSEFEMRLIATEENENRLAVPLMDRARNYKFLFDEAMAGKATVGGKKFTWADLQERLRKTSRRVRQIMELLDLPENIQKYFEEGKKNPLFPSDPLNERHGRALLTLKHDETQMRALLRQITKEKLSGTAAETRANEIRKKISPSQLDLAVAAADEQVQKEMQAQESTKTREENRAALEQGNSHLSLIGGGKGSGDSNNNSSKGSSGGAGSSARGTSGSGFHSGGAASSSSSSSTSSRTVVLGADGPRPDAPALPQSETRPKSRTCLEYKGFPADAPEEFPSLILVPAAVALQATLAMVTGFKLSPDCQQRGLAALDDIEHQVEELRKALSP